MSTAAMEATPAAVAGTASRLHVVHGVLSLELGGLERLVLDLAKIGVWRGQRVSIVCIEQRGRLADQAEALGAEVFSLNKPPGRSAAAIEQATALLQQLQPDVIHTHQIGALWYLGQAARRTSRRLVVHTEHSDHVQHAKDWWGKVKNRVRWRRSAQLAGRFCCVSDDIARSVRRWGTVPSAKVAVVLNGIDVEQYGGRTEQQAVRRQLGIPADAWVVGTVGRLNEVKRQDLLLRAFAELKTRERLPWLLVVGDGPERSRLEALVSDLGIADRTAFAGYQSRPEEFYSAMDAFALTSRHEGLPLALLEAWASGLPVVSSAVGGIPKVVDHGHSGLLFPSGDLTALVAAMERILNDQDLAWRLAASGRSVVQERYSLTRMADEYERHYRSIAATT